MTSIIVVMVLVLATLYVVEHEVIRKVDGLGGPSLGRRLILAFKMQAKCWFFWIVGALTMGLLLGKNRHQIIADCMGPLVVFFALAIVTAVAHPKSHKQNKESK
jgi:hypothetical protein